MAFLDNVVGKVTNFGHDVAQKGKNLSDTAKLTTELKNLETEKNTRLAQLGQIFYLRYSESMDEQSSAIKGRIDEISLQMEQIQQQIQQLKGVMLCPNCQKEISVHSAFCNFCGAKIEHQMIQPASGRQCPKCGAPVEAEQMFCISCGCQLNENNFVPMGSETAGQTKTCPSCGAVLDAGQVFCNQCGQRLVGADGSSSERPVFEAEAGQSQVTRICPNCGAAVEEGQAFCVGCGASLE